MQLPIHCLWASYGKAVTVERRFYRKYPRYQLKLENAAGKSKRLLEGNKHEELKSPGIDVNECTNDACVGGCMCRDHMMQIQTQNNGQMDIIS